MARPRPWSARSSPDYLGAADLRDAESVLAQLAGWIDDDNGHAPHLALGMRSPRESRALTPATASEATTTLSAAAFGAGRAIDGGAAIGARGRDRCKPLTLRSALVQRNGEHFKVLPPLAMAIPGATDSRTIDGRRIAVNRRATLGALQEYDTVNQAS